MITPVDAVKYYQDVIDYIGEVIGRPVQMVHRRTYDEMDSLLERGEVNVAFICSAPYVKNRQKFGVELLVAPSVNGRPTYQSFIIVHKESPLASFAELKGRPFAFTDPKSNTGKLYPTYLLKTMGRTPEKFFSRIVYSYSHNKSIEMVAKRLVDGAAVESIVYEHMLKKGSPYVGSNQDRQAFSGLRHSAGGRNKRHRPRSQDEASDRFPGYAQDRSRESDPQCHDDRRLYRCL